MLHIFQTQSVFSNFEHYLEIINVLYLHWESVDFDNIFKFQCKLKEIYCVDDVFSICIGVFQENSYFLYFKNFVTGCGRACIQPHFTEKSNYSKINLPRILLFLWWIVIVSYVHILYQISRVCRFWVRAKSVAANCLTKIGAYPYLSWLHIYIHCRKSKKTLIMFIF